jgi:hypothetical protein
MLLKHVTVLSQPLCLRYHIHMNLLCACGYIIFIHSIVLQYYLFYERFSKLVLSIAMVVYG